MLKSFSYAGNGIKTAFGQTNFKIQSGIACLVILLAFYFQVTTTEWCILLLCTGLVLSLEIMNTAIELFVDFVSPDFNETAGKIKDLAAGAVLLFSILSAVIGCIIFSKYITNLI